MRVFRAIGWLALSVTLATGSPAQTPPPVAVPVPLRVTTLRANAEKVFKADAFIQADSGLRKSCDTVQLTCQAIAAIVIIAGLLIKMRDESRQLEGVAAMFIKVAFIATIPFWQDKLVESVDGLAEAIGYTSASAKSPVMDDWWALLHEWSPPGTPALDALDAQTPVGIVPSGGEAAWSVNAWNWARGVGVADAAMYQSLWQAASGSLRALIVFGMCALMATTVSFIITLTYLSELLRWLLVFGGAALLPLFVAGLGIDAFRNQSVRAILGFVGVVFWPVGWGLANIVTHVIADATETWMSAAAQNAGAPFSLPAITFSVAAPYVAWGALFLFVGVSTALAVWQLANVFYVPLLLGRLLGAVGTAIGWVAPAAGQTTLAVIAPSRNAGSQRIVAMSSASRTTMATPIATVPAFVPLRSPARREAGVSRVGRRS